MPIEPDFGDLIMDLQEQINGLKRRALPTAGSSVLKATVEELQTTVATLAGQQTALETAQTTLAGQQVALEDQQTALAAAQATLAGLTTTAATGGNFSQFSITGSTGVVWANNSGFASVDIEVPADASGAVLVYMTANVMVNESSASSASGTLTSYVSFNSSGGTDGSTTDALLVETSIGISTPRSNVRVRATAVSLISLAPGLHTLRLAAAYAHTGAATGAVTINTMSIAAQVLS